MTAIACPAVVPQPKIGPQVPGGGTSCQILDVKCVCTAGVAAWGVPTTSCVANALCPAVPAYTCTPNEYTLQIQNGCAAGVPLAVTINPPCVPGCCDPLNGCLIAEYECYCNMGISVWQTNYRDCVTGTDSRCDEDTNESTSALYRVSVPNGCTIGKTVPATPVPPLTPSCCGTCQLDCLAACANGVWAVSCGAAACVAGCAADGVWVGAASSCQLTQRLCGTVNGCTVGDPFSCDSAENTPGEPAAPAAPNITTRPCCFPAPTYCIYTWMANCSDGAWVLVPTPVTGLCKTYCVAVDWTPTSSCTQQKVTCETCPSGQFC